MNPRDSKASPQSSIGPQHEPKANLGSPSVILVILLALLVYWAQLYLDGEAGGFHREVYPPYRDLAQLEALAPIGDEFEEAMKRGKPVFEANCGVCHQTSGLGMPGQFPPLAGSEWVNAPNPARVIRIPLNGLSGPVTVKGTPWGAIQMPAMGAALSDENLAAVLTYVRNSWGNKAPLVKPAEVKAVRDQFGNRSDPWTAEELLKLPETL